MVQNAPKIYFSGIEYSIVPNSDFCNTSLSKTLLLEVVSLQKITKIPSGGAFSRLQKYNHKPERIQAPIYLQFRPKKAPQKNGDLPPYSHMASKRSSEKQNCCFWPLTGSRIAVLAPEISSKNQKIKHTRSHFCLPNIVDTTFSTAQPATHTHTIFKHVYTQHR